MGGTSGEMTRMSVEYPDNKHADPLKIGEAYQEKIARIIKERYGVTIHYYKTKREQYTIGESVEGFEIKFDSWISRSGRMSIEVGEKTRKDLPHFTDSGILRMDNTKWYCQGDNFYCWVFSKKKLRDYYFMSKPHVIDDNPPTIRKFYIRLDVADKLAAKKIKL